MNVSSAIHIQNLTKSYGRVQALRGLNLEIHRGEIFGFLGPNGAGKTTTIRCLLAMIYPNGGQVSILGLDPFKQPQAVRARCGYLPGELHLEDNLRVSAALHYFAELRGRRLDWGYVNELARRLSLDLKTQIKNLSKGNKQKVGIVQAFMHQPDVLLLDEPTSGLDPLVQQEVYALVRQAQGRGATTFFSSHILGEVQEIAERVGIIRQGVLVEVAETKSLMNRSLRRVKVRFKQPITEDMRPAFGALCDVPGVTVLEESDNQRATLQVEGEMDIFLKTLAQLPVSEIDIERPSLEEVFLAYYQ